MNALNRKTKIELVVFFTETTFLLDYDSKNSSNSKEIQLFKKFEKDKYRTLFYLGFENKQDWYSPSILYLYSIADTLVKEISKTAELESIRENIEVVLPEEEIQKLKDNVPYTIGIEYVDENWIKNICDNLLLVFKDDIKNHSGTVANYYLEHSSKINIAGKIFFHLVENKNDEKYPFAFMATYSMKKVNNSKAMHTPLKKALVEFKKDESKLISLLATVSRASEQSQFISKLMDSGELFLPLRFTIDEAYTFLKEVPLYESSGIMCRVPNWWKKKSSRVVLTVNVGEKKPSRVGLEAMLDFYPDFNIDGEKISKKELKEFLKMSEGLILYKGKWIEIDHEKLQDALKIFENVVSMTDKGLTFSDAMRFELLLENELNDIKDNIEISLSNGKWFKEMKFMLTNPQKIEKVKTSKTFLASLRHYQDNGYRWLSMMSELSLGACLADDMGLGKTVQIIALLDYVRSNSRANALLIIPASLLGNWENEILKFAPKLNYQILHSSAAVVTKNWKPSEDTFLYITTYAMAVKLEMLKNVVWDYLILDEAQAIKNVGTKQTKSIKALKSKMKIAMTGTPIENRLSDLWSLFDFLNPGLLGTVKEFSGFVKKLNEDISGYAKLRKIVNPFILRRLKTDKSIISDLPDKIEIKEYTSLSKRQILLYEKLVTNIIKELEKMKKEDVAFKKATDWLVKLHIS